MEVQAPKGTKDMLPQDAYKWHFVENKFREIAKFYGMREIRTPMFEHTDLFLRGVGDTTDIVQKEMYTFNDKGNRSITLKPEGTAPVVRAFIENRLFNEAQPTKLYYAIPCFRYENVQKGRLRQFHQFGTEVFGSKEPSMDAEVIAFAMEFLKSLGLKSLSLNINNLGCPNCRPKYNEALKKFLEENYDDLCGLCQSRFEKNPMRILDCKNKNCGEITKNAPIILDYMCEECDTHFTEVKKYLDALNIPYTVDPGIVRGLDYYTGTVYETTLINNPEIGSVASGGRYENLAGFYTDKKLPGVGISIGLTRLFYNLLDAGVIKDYKKPIVDYLIIPMDGVDEFLISFVFQ